MAIITTTLGDMDESALMKSEVLMDNDNERTTVTEYCLAGCEGQWHRTHIGDAPGVFCSQHVHRSIAMHLKKGLELSGTVGGLG